MPATDQPARFREAARLTLQQLDWCVSYLHSIRKTQIARVLAKNSSAIADHLDSLDTERASRD